MLVINSIEKTRLSADSFSYSGSGVAWKARLVLFLGFALMAGGLAGSVVSALVSPSVLCDCQGCRFKREKNSKELSVQGGKTLGVDD